MVAEGEIAPDFELPDQDGNPFRLHAQDAKFLVLYFYPRAMTPGCTREAARFNELLPKFRELGAEVVGVSMDPVPRIKRFAEKLGLRFRLLSDVGGEVTRTYGVMKSSGKSAERVTFILDEKKRIMRILKNIRPAEKHADLSLEFLISQT